MRIVGWVFLLCGLVSVELTLIVDGPNHRTLGIVNGLLSIIGTLLVLYGYYRLEKNNL